MTLLKFKQMPELEDIEIYKIFNTTIFPTDKQSKQFSGKLRRVGL